NMVLQRETMIPIWGWANAGEKITVSFNKQTVSAIADANGKWSLKLKPEKAGTDFTLTIKGENTIEIKNVAVGEVWLCSGQSNMEWTVGQSINAEKELADADNPLIRQLKISRNISPTPQNDFKEGSWRVSNSTNTKDFTGVGYFFAKNLYHELKVPIGIINSSWGGTNIETWISREGFESSNEFKEMIAKMPKVDFDKLTRQKIENKTKQIEALQGVKLNALDSNAFQQASFDDSRLSTLNVPQQWESQSLGEIDGVVWYRKIINLTAEQSKRFAAIELAKIDDNDITFINGVEIGKTNQWDAPRKYKIPNGIFKEGKNVIVVKVIDTGGGGGIYGDPADVKLILGDENISLAGNWKFQVESLVAKTNENEFPSLAYNEMINPLIPYSFRGVLWYQGESNASRAYQYRTAFPLLINDWRKKWDKQFPLYFVQLATYTTAGDSNTGSDWAELREAQTNTLKLPNTGMVVTTDIGNPKDIHPTNKQEVGRRLAAIALHNVFKKNIIDSGPTFKSIKTEGNKIVVTFENIGNGLMTTDKDGIVKGFEIAGSDQIFYGATATIKGNAVIISSEKVTSPIAVHFGWKGDASANNLFNKEGFPAVPFRTEEWKTVTKEAKYKIAGF
ncbi:MAG TPA: sialate O-acetylesterase, partial [Pyrinomonadaceae bacterium]|nr:sialate O-acetylesterase [Pyrinomonadaceae bacterium]